MIVKIDVTQEDIEKGITGSCTRCPVALALRRAVPEATNAVVRKDCISVNPYDFYVESITPQKVAWFIFDFDGGGPAHPFTFEVDFK